jgi:AcrR family transcriptional regulator
MSGDNRSSRTTRLRPAERRRQIIAACLEVIGEQGFAATSMREIARQSGISVGTLLHHFEDKKAVLQGCIELIMEQAAASAEETLTGPGTPLERLDRLIDYWVMSKESDLHWRVYMAFWNEAIFDPDTESALLDGGILWDRLVSSCVRAAIETGEIAPGDPDRIGKTLSTMMSGVAIHVQARLGRWNRDEAAEICREFLRGGGLRELGSEPSG